MDHWRESIIPFPSALRVQHFSDRAHATLRRRRDAAFHPLPLPSTSRVYPIRRDTLCQSLSPLPPRDTSSQLRRPNLCTLFSVLTASYAFERHELFLRRAKLMVISWRTLRNLLPANWLSSISEVAAFVWTGDIEERIVWFTGGGEICWHDERNKLRSRDNSNCYSRPRDVRINFDRG